MAVRAILACFRKPFAIPQPLLYATPFNALSIDLNDTDAWCRVFMH